MQKSRAQVNADNIRDPQFLTPATKNMFDVIDDDDDRTVYDDADDRKAA